MRLRAFTRRDMLKVLAAGAAVGAVTIGPRPRAAAQAAGHFYLGSYVGTGAGLDPFRPRDADQPGWSAIDLRPDGSFVAGRCLVAVPVRDDTIGDYLGDDVLLKIPAPIKRRLESALGITLTASAIRDAIAEILMVHGRTDGTRWKPLRHERTTNRYRIYLGGLLFDVPVIAGGVSISENWNCADSTVINCQLTWTEGVVEVGNISIISNEVRNTVDVANSSRADSDLASDDHQVQASVKFIANLNGPSVLGVCARFSASAQTYYLFDVRSDNTTARFFRAVAGAFTQLADPTTISLTADVFDTLRLECDGSTIRTFFNDVSQHSVTDVNIVDNLRGGIRLQRINPDVGAMDTWSAADLGAAAGAGSEEDAFEDDTVIPWPWLRR